MPHFAETIRLAQIWSEDHARIAEGGTGKITRQALLKASHDCRGAFGNERIAMVGKRTHGRFWPEPGVHRSATMSQLSEQNRTFVRPRASRCP